MYKTLFMGNIFQWKKSKICVGHKVKFKVKVKISRQGHCTSNYSYMKNYGKFGLLVQLAFQRHQFQHIGLGPVVTEIW